MANDRSYQRRPRGVTTENVPSDVNGRLVPRALEMEAAVLGALMLEKDAFTAVCEILKPDSFYEPKHRMVYEAIMALGIAQEPIDIMTVTNRMRKDDTLEKVGGVQFVVELTNNVASAAHAEYHARIVAQKYLARQLISFASSIENLAFDETNDVDDLLQDAEKNLFEISQRNVKRDAVQIDPVIDQAIQKMQLASQQETGLSGLSSGFSEIDKITSGWQNSDLIIIAARPGMGKTAFVLSMALNIAINNNPIAVFTLEMSSLQLVNRLISNVCEITGDQIKTGRLSTGEWQKVAHNVRRLQGAPIYIDDTSGLSILELRTKARRLAREHGIKMIVIDYLQLMNASGMNLGSREQEVSTISRSLKQLAKELDIPIVALSQLNRKLEERSSKEKRPQLSDLRESGAIEQDADIVCFIHRPEKFAGAENAEGEDLRGVAEFIIAKHRSGRVDTVKLRFNHDYTRFENWTDATTFGLRAASDNPTAPQLSEADVKRAAEDARALTGAGPQKTNDAFLKDDTPPDEPF